MRTIIDLPEEQAQALAALGQREHLSGGELVLLAVTEYLERHRYAASGERAFGLWQGRRVDALAYQDRLRGEWD